MSVKLDQINQLAEEISVCEACSLHLARKKAVPGEGNVSTQVMFIGEAPGANENETGRPFVGQAGNFLNQLIQAAGLSRREVFIANVVKCRPPSNRDPMTEELTACAHFLNRQIEIIDPLVIVTLGRYSMARYFPLERISQIHGQGKWVNNRLIVPMFHPAAALHQPNLRPQLEKDFAMLPAYLEEAKRKRFPVVEEPAAEKKEETPAVQEEPRPQSFGGEAEQLSLF